MPSPLRPPPSCLHCCLSRPPSLERHLCHRRPPSEQQHHNCRLVAGTFFLPPSNDIHLCSRGVHCSCGAIGMKVDILVDDGRGGRHRVPGKARPVILIIGLIWAAAWEDHCRSSTGHPSRQSQRCLTAERMMRNGGVFVGKASSSPFTSLIHG